MQLYLFDKAPAALMWLDIEHLPLTVDLVVGLKLRTCFCMPDPMLITACKQMLHDDPVNAALLKFRPDSDKEQVECIVLLK